MDVMKFLGKCGRILIVVAIAVVLILIITSTWFFLIGHMEMSMEMSR